jgi:short-subunit dehydrogenase
VTAQVLAGQTALITGASRGIGAATAQALAAAGAHVILVARTAEKLEAVEDAIHASGGSATIAPLDLTDGESIIKLATAIAGRWDALDMLVLNAAMLGTLSPVAAIDGKEINRLFTLNVLSQQAMIAAFNPLLRRSKSAKLIAVTSSVGSVARPYWGAYGATKAALELLVNTYGEEMRNTSAIRTAIIDPGATRTEMRARAYPGEDPNAVKDPAVVGEAIARLCIAGFDSGTRIRV